MAQGRSRVHQPPSQDGRHRRRHEKCLVQDSISPEGDLLRHRELPPRARLDVNSLRWNEPQGMRYRHFKEPSWHYLSNIKEPTEALEMTIRHLYMEMCKGMQIAPTVVDGIWDLRSLTLATNLRDPLRNLPLVSNIIWLPGKSAAVLFWQEEGREQHVWNHAGGAPKLLATFPVCLLWLHAAPTGPG